MMAHPSRRYLPCTRAGFPIRAAFQDYVRLQRAWSVHPSMQLPAGLPASIVLVARHHEVNPINFAGFVRFYCQGLLVILNLDCQSDCSSLFSNFRFRD